ncbi:MAG: hypothetical protein AAGI48_16295 [Verrucomicrobiota bacterium]
MQWKELAVFRFSDEFRVDQRYRGENRIRARLCGLEPQQMLAMNLRIDATDRKALDAAFEAVVTYGSVRQAISHHASEKDSSKTVSRKKSRKANNSLAKILSAKR